MHIQYVDVKNYVYIIVRKESLPGKFIGSNTLYFFAGLVGTGVPSFPSLPLESFHTNLWVKCQMSANTSA